MVPTEASSENVTGGRRSSISQRRPMIIATVADRVIRAAPHCGGVSIPAVRQHGERVTGSPRTAGRPFPPVRQRWASLMRVEHKTPGEHGSAGAGAAPRAGRHVPRRRARLDKNVPAQRPPFTPSISKRPRPAPPRRRLPPRARAWPAGGNAARRAPRRRLHDRRGAVVPLRTRRPAHCSAFGGVAPRRAETVAACRGRRSRGPSAARTARPYLGPRPMPKAPVYPNATDAPGRRLRATARRGLP